MYTHRDVQIPVVNLRTRRGEGPSREQPWNETTDADPQADQSTSTECFP